MRVAPGERVRFVLRNTDPIDHEFILGDDAVQRRHEEGRERQHHGDVPGERSVPAGQEAANGMFDAGADVVYAAAGGSGLGVFQSALANDAYGIGVDSDQYESVGASNPELQPVILTSMLKRVDVAVFDALQAFVDGEELGLGAEIGISTQKLHARGPMGLRELTTLKYVVHGTGQTRT